MKLRCDALHTRDDIAHQRVTVVTRHTLLSSPLPPSSTIPPHHPRSRNENSLDTPPNTVSTHHLSVDSQQMQIRTQTDAKNRKYNPNHPETDQNISQDHECGEPTPPRTSPLPLSSRDVGVHKTSKPPKDRSTIELRHDTTHHRRRGSGGNQGGNKGPQPFQGGAATSSFDNVFRVLSCTIPRL